MAESGGGFCIDCGHHVDSFENLKGCPSCGSKSYPASDVQQLKIEVNWHELRVLVMWAENWQRRSNLGRVVYSIARRLEAQFPDLAKSDPLTLAGELGIVAGEYDISVSDPKLRRDIAEQTGKETGLVDPNKAEDEEG